MRASQPIRRDYLLVIDFSQRLICSSFVLEKCVCTVYYLIIICIIYIYIQINFNETSTIDTHQKRRYTSSFILWLWATCRPPRPPRPTRKRVLRRGESTASQTQLWDCTRPSKKAARCPAMDPVFLFDGHSLFASMYEYLNTFTMGKYMEAGLEAMGFEELVACVLSIGINTWTPSVLDLHTKLRWFGACPFQVFRHNMKKSWLLETTGFGGDWISLAFVQ